MRFTWRVNSKSISIAISVLLYSFLTEIYNKQISRSVIGILVRHNKRIYHYHTIIFVLQEMWSTTCFKDWGFRLQAYFGFFHNIYIFQIASPSYSAVSNGIKRSHSDVQILSVNFTQNSAVV